MGALKKITKIALWKQIVIMALLGALLGILSPEWGAKSQLLGNIFISLVKMCIVPLIFTMIVLGVAKMNSGKDLGRLTLKVLIYFEVITTLLMIISVGLCNIFNVGGRANLTTSVADAATVERFTQSTIEFKSFIMHMVPSNIIQSMAEANLLAIIVFGAFFGVGLGALKEKGQPLVNIFDCVANTMFKILGYVIKLSPIGVFGFLAYSVATYGLEKMASLVDLILVVYLGLAITVLIIFPLICKIFGVKYLELLGRIKDLLIIAFATRSSESVLAPLMERLDNYGVDKSVVSFVLPLGFSFNLDGGSIYWPVAILFVANAFGVPLDFGQQVQLIIVLMLLSKGVAGVVGGNFVVLTSICAMFGLPLEGIALIFAVDFITDVARTTVNVMGNSIATVVMAKSEKKFFPNKQIGVQEA